MVMCGTIVLSAGLVCFVIALTSALTPRPITPTRAVCILSFLLTYCVAIAKFLPRDSKRGIAIESCPSV